MITYDYSPNYSFATRKRRAIAAILDNIFTVLLTLLMEFSLHKLELRIPVKIATWSVDILQVASYIMIWVVYYSIEGGKRQATWGKRIIGIVLCNANNLALGHFRSLFRYMVYKLMTIFIPFVLAIIGFASIATTYGKLPYALHLVIPGLIFIIAQMLYFTVLYNKRSGQFLHDRIFAAKVMRNL